MVSIKLATALIAGVTAVAAQRPADTSICDYYTTALLKNNTAENQLTLLTLVVNTAVIGNYTQPNVGVAVPGILAPGMYMGSYVNLAPYFTGALNSSNRGGSSGVSVNFLDGGGAAPLMKNMPANDTSSNQYFLLTHLYEYFGALLGCSMYGMGAYPAYMGQGSQYQVHKFMALDSAQVGYFIQQVALSGASFGVAQDDLTAVGKALTSLFDVRCGPASTVIPSQGPQLQSICIDADCALSANATCDAYAPVIYPQNVTMSNATATASSTATMTASSTASSTAAVTAGAASMGVSIFALAGGFAALML